MIALKLDTTTAKKAQVKIFRNSELVTETENESPVISIQEALEKANLQLAEIDEFSANPGPGSYTGIRVGLSVVNALNFALGKEFKSVEPIYN